MDGGVLCRQQAHDDAVPLQSQPFITLHARLQEGFDAQGAVGKVRRVYDQPNLSANREVKVEFDEPKKWIGHFKPSELELTETAPRTMIHGG